MRKLGFADKWCKWIMKCIASVSYSILINGNPVGPIHPKRGIRQGDPISPYIYLLCTEGLSALIQNTIRTRKLHGFKASRNGPPISHLLFGDDSLLFCKATEDECEQIIQILKIYEKATGQTVNLNKSAVIFGKRLASDVKENICNRLGITKSTGFGRYIGLPEFIGRNKFNAFSYITQKLENKVSSWYSKLLSPAGKETLLKAIATAIPAYSMSCFLLPKRAIDQMTRAMRRFWWSSTKEKHGISWIAWRKITNSKKTRRIRYKRFERLQYCPGGKAKLENSSKSTISPGKSFVGTEIHTVDFRLNKETRKPLISQRSQISANTTR